jgi:hypothetical protein
MPNTPYEASLPDDAALAQARETLRARIPGWGADLDPADRPSVPQERREPTGAHWTIPDRQKELLPREKSVEHSMLTPVFGTSIPLRGLSGLLRRLSYERYSEGRAAHWLILLGADRVDAIESHLRSFATLRPDNPITETGVLSEVRRHGVSSRVGKNRADLRHVAGPWVLAGWALVRLARSRRS